MTKDDARWRAEFDRHKRFVATPLGVLYQKYEHALIDYWRHDGDEAVSPAKLTALDERRREATQAFIAKLKELAGV